MNLFDDLDLGDMVKPKEIPPPPTKEVKTEKPVDEKQPQPKVKTKEKKEDEQDTINLEKEIKTLTKTIEKLEMENKELIEGNTIIVDAQNFDDRKKLMALMKEGKIIRSVKDRAFIMAEQYAEIYTITKPPIHCVYCDEIVGVNIRTYYMDLKAPKGNREVIRKIYWVHHKGYSVMSTISEEQFKYLLDNVFIHSKDIMYSYIDASTYESIVLQGDDAEPSDKFVLKELKRLKDIYDNANSKKKSFGKVETNTEDDVAMSEETENSVNDEDKEENV